MRRKEELRSERKRKTLGDLKKEREEKRDKMREKVREKDKEKAGGKGKIGTKE